MVRFPQRLMVHLGRSPFHLMRDFAGRQSIFHTPIPASWDGWRILNRSRSRFLCPRRMIRSGFLGLQVFLLLSWIVDWFNLVVEFWKFRLGEWSLVLGLFFFPSSLKEMFGWVVDWDSQKIWFCCCICFNCEWGYMKWKLCKLCICFESLFCLFWNEVFWVSLIHLHLFDSLSVSFKWIYLVLG